ncbi:hypothetical protein ILUMI_20820 [Ignelater luminosus]|uniref:Uncharacterized protein n=1 Tax=Ignelater luminosus TaxID=2038154 RepID=A0A8K0CGR4_IGNLU|nr:hypothetical protein ILUMI_20820 [Ignelater luminosus]
MRAIKRSNGLTHGRGLADSTLVRWIALMPIADDIIDQAKHFNFKQAAEDANTLIATSAVDVVQYSNCVVVVGNDTDLLVILTASVLLSPQHLSTEAKQKQTRRCLYCTNVQIEIPILDPDNCDIDCDDILEERRRHLDDDLNNEEMEKLDFM